MASFARLAGRAVAGAGVLALSPVLGLATLAGMAMVGAEAATFTVTGLAVFASVFFLGLLLCVPRPRAVWGRWLRALVILGVEAAVVWPVGVATLRPPQPSAPPAPVAGQREWRLPTGSELAYVRFAPKRVTRPDPVVFLHGGPGVADLAASSAFFRKLTADGYQVYVYDQLGAGRSARLRDPREYGLTRDVEDLEAIRQTVGADRLNLIARDYGAQLATAYLAAHPDRVAKAVLASPTGLPPARKPDGEVELAAMFGPGGSPDPRLLAVSTLLRVDPQAAHAFAGDRELDAYLGLVRQGAPHPCPAAAATGSGGYVGLTGRTAPSSLPLSLSEAKAPVLIVKSRCDEEGWTSAMAYRRALPSATLAYLDDEASTNAYASEPYLGVLRAFLSGRPVKAYEGERPPPGYRGPS
ncbi:alpha/beta fold hydrolase [Nonomuraea sp. NPDC052116]|uniref:alpha/beta fold hydrolase n=1 Tax=Nonomuraea sp. NPDC052116 TaxID=3155665 RepID=UPI003429E993